MSTLVGSLLLGADADVLAYMKTRLPALDFGPCITMGIVRAGALIGAVVFNNFRFPDIEMAVAADTSHWANPRTLRAIFTYPFITLACTRVTLATPRWNRSARQAALKSGFRLEGVKRKAAPDGADIFHFGMLREECRYLPKGA